MCVTFQLLDVLLRARSDEDRGQIRARENHRDGEEARSLGFDGSGLSGVKAPGRRMSKQILSNLTGTGESPPSGWGVFRNNSLTQT